MTRLADLVETSERVAAVSGRNAKVAKIAELLRALAPDEIDLAVAWLAGETRQSRHGIGYATVQAAMPPVPAAVPTLALRDLDDSLDAIARIAGRGAAGERKRQLAALLTAATAAEQSFIVRLLTGELRQGALEGLMIEAVARASSLPVAEVRRAAMVAGGIAVVAAPSITGGTAALRGFSIALMQPLAPMLAQPADDIEDALARVRPASLEWKLDGARVQVHKQGAEVRIFTRTGNDVTAAAPEIVEAVGGFRARSLILDGEAIALLPDGSPYPFQDTMRRFGRALRVDEMRLRMPLSVFFFDCLRRDDDDLVARKGSERFAALAEVVPAAFLIPRLVAGDLVAAQAFYDDAVQRKHEGVMVKQLDAPYEPGARSAAWLKVKRVHTLDLVVLAAEWGHGRRHGRLSNLHLGARAASAGAFVMLGKTFKGLTDAILDWQTQELLARETHRDAWTVYVRPELVVEITFNDLQASPRYPGGLALRFARLKGYRPDKHAADADTMETVRAIYAGQRSAAR